MKNLAIILSIIILLVTSACQVKKTDKELYSELALIKPSIDKITPRPKYIKIYKRAQEMRAVWITTAYNLDWPSKAISTSTEAEYQKQELLNILDELKSDGYNTIFFQVRTSLGVCYPSSLEPWAITMVKEGAKAYFDPTEFALKECHKRGMKFHAWFVTYPLGGKSAIRLRKDYRILSSHPSWILLHRGSYYLDPGNPKAREYIAQVIEEAVKKYNFDGVHLDYIRYPEGINSFPDSLSYRLYGDGKDLDSWRRDNISETIALIKQTILKERPRVLLSAAPLGKLRRLPDYIIGRKYGWTAYESVMQDPEEWAKKKYVDFLVPMMYYRNELFTPFLEDWIQRVGQYCPIVVGLAPYKIVTESNPLWNISDITNQIRESRNNGASGVAMFRYRFVSNRYPYIRFAIREEFNADMIRPEQINIRLSALDR